MKRIAVFGALLAALVVGLTASSASAVPLVSLPVGEVNVASSQVARDQCIQRAVDAHLGGYLVTDLALAPDVCFADPGWVIGPPT